MNELLREFRRVLDDYTNKDGLERVMMTEGYVGNEELMEYYGNIDQQTGIGDISHMPINFCLLSDFKTDQFDVCPLKLKNTLCSYLDSCKEKMPGQILVWEIMIAQEVQPDLVLRLEALL